MQGKGLHWLVLAVTLALLACHSVGGPRYYEEGVPPKDKDVTVTPLGISVNHEILGRVSVSREEFSNIQDVYKGLSDECKKMGGDMVINVRSGKGAEDLDEDYPLTEGYEEHSLYPNYGKPYLWGSGTVIRIKDPSKRKAYWDAKKKERQGEACAIVGLPEPEP
jgi:hypothetical protein